MQNPCGGLAWEMRDDGLIEVEGVGTPAYEPGSIQFRQMEQTWANWGSLMRRAASRNGIPASWILAIATEETGLWSANANEQGGKTSGAGAIGVMQIMPATGAGFGASADALFDPATNIDVGAALLAKLASFRNGQLPEMAAIYNSGRACDPGRNQWNLAMAGDYAGNVIKWNNAAVMYLDMSARGGLLLGVTLGAAGLYAAAVVAGLAATPRFARRWV
jgi:hypothetical protein